MAPEDETNTLKSLISTVYAKELFIKKLHTMEGILLPYDDLNETS